MSSALSIVPSILMMVSPILIAALGGMISERAGRREHRPRGPHGLRSLRCRRGQRPPGGGYARLVDLGLPRPRLGGGRPRLPHPRLRRDKPQRRPGRLGHGHQPPRERRHRLPLPDHLQARAHGFLPPGHEGRARRGSTRLHGSPSPSSSSCGTCSIAGPWASGSAPAARTPRRRLPPASTSGE